MKAISNFKKFCKFLVLNNRLIKASRKADRLQLKTGITHYVVQSTRRGHLLVMTRKDYRVRVGKGKALYVTAEQMYQGCFYCTRWYNKDNPTPQRVIDQKRKNWFAANGL